MINKIESHVYNKQTNKQKATTLQSKHIIRRLDFNFVNNKRKFYLKSCSK